MMNFVLIHADPAGETSLIEQIWDTQPGEFTPPSPAGYEVSKTFSAQGIVMMHHPEGYEDEWHCAPAPVLGTVLRGQVRIETSNGDHRILQPGEQFVASDLTGRGHKMEEQNGQRYDLALTILEEASVDVLGEIR